MAEKLYSMQSVGSRRRKKTIDSVANDMKHDRDARGLMVLMQAEGHYHNMYRYRRERERTKKYVFGKQWDDIIINENGDRVTEEDYIRSEGKVPLKNNLMRRLVRNVVGVYRMQSKEPVCVARDRNEQSVGETMSTILQCNMQRNSMNEMYARTMEEYLIGGFVSHRKWYGWNDNGLLDCWTTYVQPNNFIIDSNMRDIRGWDCCFVGEIHSMSFGKLVTKYAKNPQDYEWLKRIYSYASDPKMFVDTWNEFGYPRFNDLDFFVPKQSDQCRVIEVWRKESKERYFCHDYNSGRLFKIEIEDYASKVEAVNADRLMRGRAMGMAPEDIPLIKAEWKVDNYWYYYHLTPYGDIIEEGESPYAHGSHPYVFKGYPFIDGEIHSFASDFIDQQRYTNRLISLFDWIMKSSAKGVLLMPAQALEGTGMTIDEIADAWQRYDGVIVYTAKPGVPTPQQVAVNSTNIGITELLNIQLKMFEDISGVNGALQGRPGFSGESGSHAQVMTQNATTSLIDILDSFSSFIVDASYKDLKNMQQFYDSKMVFNIAGKGKMAEYNPETMSDIELDVSVVESTSTPAYRQIANEFIMKIWESGQITLEQMLESGDFPFGDDLLQAIRSQGEAIAKGKEAAPVNPALMQQAQNGADMNAVNKAYNMLRAA